MPISVHKILLHGAVVMDYATLHIGMLSEEAQESSNKTYKRLRLHHTRKRSRIDTTRDLLHMLLVESDPLISSMRSEPKSKETELPADALAMIIPEAEFDNDEEAPSSADEESADEELAEEVSAEEVSAEDEVQ